MSSSVLSHLNELTLCCICFETFSDPRMLPCQHTYCKACLEELSKEKRRGDSIACPQCRREFNIPANGIDGVEKSLAIIALSDELNKLHKPCEIHANKSLDLFCETCKVRMCLSCLRDEHRQHDWSEFNETGEVMPDIPRTTRTGHLSVDNPSANTTATQHAQAPNMDDPLSCASPAAASKCIPPDNAAETNLYPIATANVFAAATRSHVNPFVDNPTALVSHATASKRIASKTAVRNHLYPIAMANAFTAATWPHNPFVENPITLVSPAMASYRIPSNVAVTNLYPITTTNLFTSATRRRAKNR